MYERFEKLMKEKGMKVSDVCRLTGIAASTMSDWKSGRSVPKNDKLAKIAALFDVPVSWIVSGDPGLPADAPAYYYNEDARDLARFLTENPDYKALFDASRKVKPEDVDFIRQMIERTL